MRYWYFLSMDVVGRLRGLVFRWKIFFFRVINYVNLRYCCRTPLLGARGVFYGVNIMDPMTIG